MVALVTSNNSIKSKNNEWYTPAKYIEAAREVFGGVIDLDPASCELANRTVKATRYYTREDDGLSKEWYGNVWCNPPYIGGIGVWISHLIQQYSCSNIQQAIILYPAAQGALTTKWFHSLLDYPICIPYKRISFYADTGYLAEQPNFSSIFTYLGPHEQKFIDTFSVFGRIAKAVATPRKEVLAQLWEVK